MSAVLIPEIERAAITIRADTVNREARTVEVIWAEGAQVRRYDWREGGWFVEELSMDPAHIRLDRFAHGMSLLDAHNPLSMDDRLGTVVPGSVRLAGGKAFATVKLSRKPRAEELFQDLVDGHSFPLSVGYRVHAFEKTEGSGDSLPVLRATDWEPMELSAVPIPADAGAHALRAANEPNEAKREVPVRDRSEGQNTMPNTQPNQHADPALAERERAAGIRNLAARIPGVDTTLVERAVNQGMSLTDFRSAALDAIVERQEQAPTFPHAAPASGDGRRSETDLRAEAIFARSSPSHTLSEPARPFAHASFADHARDLLRASGQSVLGQSPAQLVTRALHSTSDFPLIVGAAAERAVREGYAVQDTEIRQTARATTLNDFKVHHSVNLSAAPRLLLVNEHGEYKRGSFTENAEGYGLSTFGRIIGLTRQLLINDDLSVFERISPKMGQAARDFELSSLVALVEANPDLSDGYPVFSAEHKNLGVGASLSVESLSAARLAMRRQVGLAGEPIGVRPRFLIVPAELETEAEKVLAAIAAAKVEDVNVFTNRLTLIVEHRLTDPAAWYLSADPAQIDGVEYAHLAGAAGPHFETKAGWDIDGIEIKVRLDFGAGWIDHRGWYKNPGR